MEEPLTANNTETTNHTPKDAPLHLQMSEDERILWIRANLGIFRQIAAKHLIDGKPVSAVYVSNIYYGLSRLRSPLAKRISRSIDRAIERSRRTAA